MKKAFKEFIMIVCVLSLGLTFSVRADSGWDGGYDGGGYSGAGYSGGSYGGYDGGYDSDWGSDYSSSSGGYSRELTGTDAFLFYFPILVTMLVIIIYCVRGTKRNKPIRDDRCVIYYDIPESELQKYLPDMTLSKLKEILFKDFVDVQNAWMDFDYDKLRELCSDELYNSYIAQLDALKIKNGKNVMSDFVVISNAITSINEEAGVLSVKAYMIVSFKDYVINTKTDEVIRGNDKKMITNRYIMTFVKGKDDIATNCPNCGSPLKDSASSVCEYCRSTISKTTCNFVLSKKTCVNDRKGDISDDLK